MCAFPHRDESFVVHRLIKSLLHDPDVALATRFDDPDAAFGPIVPR